MSEDSSHFSKDGGRNSSGKQQPIISKLPKRPLSAYNIFFQHERDRILCSYTDLNDRSQVDQDIAGHCTLGRDPSLRVDRSKKSCPPPHGKIAFAELARNIGRKWRKLDGAEKSYYLMLAKKEKSRYERELAEYYGIGAPQATNATLRPVFKGGDGSFLSSPSSVSELLLLSQGIQDLTGTEAASPTGLGPPIAHSTSTTSNGQDERVKKNNCRQCIHPPSSVYSSAMKTQSWERFVRMNTSTTVRGQDQAQQDIALMKKSTTSGLRGNVVSAGSHTMQQPLLHTLPTSSVSDVASLPAAEMPSCSSSSLFLMRQQEQASQPQRRQRQQEPLIIGDYYDPFPLLPGKPCHNEQGFSQHQPQLDDSSATSRLPLPPLDLNLEMQDMLSRLLESDQFWGSEK